jgi:hypothetical protein
VEKVRTVIRMTAQNIADTGCKRRLEVTKSNGKYPHPLGMTMNDCGNDYDTDPPPPPENSPFTGAAQTGRPPNVVRECMDWLGELLATGPVKVGEITDEADRKGIAERTLYRARALLKLETLGGYSGKKWALPGDSDEPIPE